MYEQRYIPPSGVAATLAQSNRPQVQVGSTDAQPLIPCDGEVFGLRKLLPATPEYDFNMHVMTFEPGEFLTVKEVHFNQHGLLLLEGQGVYRLGDKWCASQGSVHRLLPAYRRASCRYPVRAGDAIWMAPYVVQWYGALGKERSRYIINKDTSRDPLLAA